MRILLIIFTSYELLYITFPPPSLKDIEAADDVTVIHRATAFTSVSIPSFQPVSRSAYAIAEESSTDFQSQGKASPEPFNGNAADSHLHVRSLSPPPHSSSLHSLPSSPHAPDKGDAPYSYDSPLPPRLADNCAPSVMHSTPHSSPHAKHNVSLGSPIVPRPHLESAGESLSSSMQSWHVEPSRELMLSVADINTSLSGPPSSPSFASQTLASSPPLFDQGDSLLVNILSASPDGSLDSNAQTQTMLCMASPQPTAEVYDPYHEFTVRMAIECMYRLWRTPNYVTDMYNVK